MYVPSCRIIDFNGAHVEVQVYPKGGPQNYILGRKFAGMFKYWLVSAGVVSIDLRRGKIEFEEHFDKARG